MLLELLLVAAAAESRSSLDVEVSKAVTRVPLDPESSVPEVLDDELIVVAAPVLVSEANELGVPVLDEEIASPLMWAHTSQVTLAGGVSDCNSKFTPHTLLTCLYVLERTTENKKMNRWRG
jgi:hypothetical protein